MTDQRCILQQFLRRGERALLFGVTGAAYGRLTKIGCFHLIGNGGSQCINLVTKLVNITSINRVVKRGIGATVS
ncbi:hypothetical protein D3C84_913590 [compost metagenome]